MDRGRALRAITPALIGFADRLRNELGAEHLFLFGPRTRGDLRPDTDYDFVLVASAFQGVDSLDRGHGLYRLWRESGGWGPLHPICLAPEEFERVREGATFVNAVLPESIDLLSADVSAGIRETVAARAASPVGEDDPVRPPELREIEPAVRRFAERLREEIGAEQVLLFGSQARGTAAPDSDHDLLIVAGHFRGVPTLQRSIGLWKLFREAGGHAPIDLICLTPEEFDGARGRVSLVSEVLPEAIDLLPAVAST